MLPDQICKLTALTDLYLTFNRLTTLPERIGDLTSLKILNLHSNRLTTLPKRICDLTSLEILDINSNQLTALPDQICKLTALRVLNLRQSYELTPSPVLLDGLCELEERGCQIDYPDQITLELRASRAESRRLQKSRLQLESRTLFLSGLDDKSNLSKLDDQILKKIAEFTDTSLLSEAEIEAAFKAAEEGVKQTERYKKHVDANSTANNQESETKSVTASPAEVIVSEKAEEAEEGYKSDSDELPPEKDIVSGEKLGSESAITKAPASGERAEEPGGFATRRTFAGRVCDALSSIFPKTSISTTKTPAQQLQNNNPPHLK